VRKELQDFLAQNANHRRAGEARLTLAKVTRREASAQMSLALAQRGDQERIDEGAKARRLLEDAEKELQAVVKDAGARRTPAPDTRTAEKADKRRLEAAAAQAKFDLAVNLLDQAVTYPDIPRGNYRALRAKKVEEAQKAFQPLTTGDRDSPYTWMSQ